MSLYILQSPMKRIAINGFGRIGRQALKIALEKEHLEIVAINDLGPIEFLAHLLKYDTVYGNYEHIVKVEVDGRILDTDSDHNLRDGELHGDEHEIHLIVGEKRIRVLSQPDPEILPWEEMAIDVVLECTGRFTKDRAADAHIRAGAKHVILSTTAKGEGDVPTHLVGVNDDRAKGNSLISNASCTSNCVGPVTAVMLGRFGIQKAMMTTIHAFTATQNLVDTYSRNVGKDLRRARAAANNIVPTSTGAAIATTKVFPELENKFDGIAIRVPVITGSLTDFTFLLERKTSVEEINEAFKGAANNPVYKGVLQITNEPIVSSDIIGNTASAIVDLGMTRVVDGDFVKVLAWYDNEAGYATRLVEMIDSISA